DWIDIPPADADDEQDNGKLYGDENRVGEGAFADADDQNQGDGGDDDHGREVDPGAGRAKWVVADHARELETEGGLKEFVEVAGPARGHGGAAHGVFKDQIPADDPGGQLAERGVSVGVGAAGHGNHRGELGVAKGSQATADAGDGVGNDHSGPGVV